MITNEFTTTRDLKLRDAASLVEEIYPVWNLSVSRRVDMFLVQADALDADWAWASDDAMEVA